MHEPGKHKLSDAIPQPAPDRSGRPETTHATEAETSREAQESREAHDAEASIRDRMIDIGRGNRQSGRH